MLKPTSKNSSQNPISMMENERPLEPVWSLYSLFGSIFFVALYAVIFFHPTRSTILLFLAVGPVVFRGLFLIAGRIASMRPSSPPASRFR